MLSEPQASEESTPPKPSLADMLAELERMDVARLALGKGLDRSTMAMFFRSVAAHINADLQLRLYP